MFIVDRFGVANLSVVCVSRLLVDLCAFVVYCLFEFAMGFGVVLFYFCQYCYCGLLVVDYFVLGCLMFVLWVWLPVNLLAFVLWLTVVRLVVCGLCVGLVLGWCCFVGLFIC